MSIGLDSGSRQVRASRMTRFFSLTFFRYDELFSFSPSPALFISFRHAARDAASIYIIQPGGFFFAGMTCVKSPLLPVHRYEYE